MPTVPNRYYNSPWIAEATANLTDALFGNPEREAASLRGQQIRAEMARQQEADKREAADRLAYDTGMKSFADVVSGIQPDPKTGQWRLEDMAQLASIAATIPGAKSNDLMNILNR